MNEMLLIIGPAGSGKTTLCKSFENFKQIFNKKIFYVNLDPGVNNIQDYNYNISDIISQNEVTNEL